MTIDLREDEITLADHVAAGVAKKWRRVQVDDVKSELRVWLCENHKYLVRWREEGMWGRNKLRASLRRKANKFCRQEFETVKPWTVDYEYTEQAVHALLEALFSYSDWSEIAGDSGSDVWASLADVSSAFETLSEVDRDLLKARFGLGLRFGEIADRFELSSSDAARMRVNRAVGRVAERASRGTVRWTAGADLSARGEFWNGQGRGAVE
jgi:DNA-directed RNA polymerase specialized sigma24 family protein